MPAYVIPNKAKLPIHVPDNSYKLVAFSLQDVGEVEGGVDTKDLKDEKLTPPYLIAYTDEKSLRELVSQQIDFMLSQRRDG